VRKPSRSWQRAARGAGLVVSLFLLLLALSLGLAWIAHGSGNPASEAPKILLGDIAPASAGGAPAGNVTGVTLGILTDSSAICVGGLSNCPAQTATAQITLTANVGSPKVSAWPAVQMLFLVETTPYDGVYDPSAGVPGADPCGDAQYGVGPLCEESNGVPFFVANAASITHAIARAHPYTNMSFGLADYFATGDQFDSGGGAYYHVDVGQFLNASVFPNAATTSFQAKTLGGGFVLPRSDLDDNFLHSSSITALYGGLEGAGLNWTAGAHHVIVLIGATAPRDPHYPENYCVSPAVTPVGLTTCVAPTCEPANELPQGYQVPQCEGWVSSNTTNRSADIATLASAAPACTQSYGGNCTIDAIDLYETPTDPSSPSWSASGGAGGPVNWTADATNILRAGCDIASATGGSWDGPNWYSCPNGWAGTLALVGHGSAGEPNVTNPSLMAAFSNTSVGEPGAVFPAAGSSGHPLFLFVPYGSVAVSPVGGFTQKCANATGVPFICPGPTRVFFGQTVAYGWNITNSPLTNGLRAGDTWSSTFDVQVNGPPYAVVPIDACTTLACRLAGSGPVLGNYTVNTYRAYAGSLITALSFPVALFQVQPDSFGLPQGPPGAPVEGIPPPSPGAGGTPPPTSAPASPAAVPALPVAAQGITAGTIAAGAIRLGIRGSGVEVKTATPAGGLKKKKGRRGPTYVGHWE
jgi:hypothetical protein